MTGVYKIAAMISVSDELLIEMDQAGPRFRSITDRNRWLELWRESQPWEAFSYAYAPPWEYWDNPVAISPVFWPHTEATCARLLASWRWLLRERRLLRHRLAGLRDGWLLREANA